MTTLTLCGRCNHPMHWSTCGRDATSSAGPCPCRNDYTMTDPGHISWYPTDERTDRARAVDEANALGYREGYRAAVAAERARIRAAVEAWDPATGPLVQRECDCHRGQMRPAREPHEFRAAVLAIVNPEADR